MTANTSKSALKSYEKWNGLLNINKQYLIIYRKVWNKINMNKENVNELNC